jgi:trehalose 6-phosphate phosphatase
MPPSHPDSVVSSITQAKGFENPELGPKQLPQPWANAQPARQAFAQQLRQAAQPLLICDYDGTLALFQEDKMQALPYPGVAERLAAIAAGRTRLAFVSGRPIDELILLLPLAAKAEVWGMHGREHRLPSGARRMLDPSAAQKDALDAAEAHLRRQGYANWMERKAASVALHWRALNAERDGARLKQVRSDTEAAFAPHAGHHGLGILPFDGGLELRAEDHTKGHATEALLSGADASSAVFLGDDTTDEDAFLVLRRLGGLGFLVRTPPRASHAQYSIEPPAGLLSFLEEWDRATSVH